eukprot:6207839-Heterocapsa_arctica.AAC.1
MIHVSISSQRVPSPVVEDVVGVRGGGVAGVLLVARLGRLGETIGAAVAHPEVACGAGLGLVAM